MIVRGVVGVGWGGVWCGGVGWGGVNSPPSGWRESEILLGRIVLLGSENLRRGSDFDDSNLSQS